MLIARAFPVMHVYTKLRGGQKAYKGHVITLPHDVQQLADVLPRCPKDLPVIVFTVNGKNNCSEDFIVRLKKVSDALYWLTGVEKHGEPNNFLYKDVRISKENLTQLPENGVHSNVLKVECQVENNGATSSHIKVDSGPVEYDGNERVYNSDSKMVVLFLQMSVPKKKNKLLKMPSLSNHNLMIGLLAVSLEMNSMCSS